MEYRELIREALKYRENAYVPYSRFKVGAAVIMDDNKVYGGCNVENASFGATNCAERTAIFKAVSEGNKKLKAIAVVGDTSTYTAPCGICRQVIAEFGDENTDIIIIKNENDYKIKKLEDILPGAFTKEDINK
ncbi:MULTISPECIES: cytidine deaminase [Clostridium]|uniref:Cytidine deaminase n=2 Tax=Clostridium TaxID=1485 RepID=A0A151ALS0_9CLOT|nr:MULTISPECIES: cytidine deaminase [Clostridium]KYH28584.1 cytidine deaminase [Clostridium colicanis DSM 13634]MBE6042876.1 cytidine deaminase [Clostridium thermopalmarium]PRR74128.1 Cytidine deaminase [Clostridium thermopalmarium DSM 5974]PVZ25456.1 cytidine deaminase [Clostridium thermopalmarium DSM 5974]